jgi:hypothetical protein
MPDLSKKLRKNKKLRLSQDQLDILLRWTRTTSPRYVKALKLYYIHGWNEPAVVSEAGLLHAPEFRRVQGRVEDLLQDVLRFGPKQIIKETDDA